MWCCDHPSDAIAETSVKDLIALEAAISRRQTGGEVEAMRRKRLDPRLEIVDGNDLYRRRKSKELPSFPELSQSTLESSAPSTGTSIPSIGDGSPGVRSTASTASTPRTSGDSCETDSSTKPGTAPKSRSRRSRLFRFLL